MSVTADEIRWRLLVSAAEDHTPLFHAMWEFGGSSEAGAGAPTESDIRHHLWRLVEDGLVDLFHGTNAEGDFIPVPPADRERIFTDPRSWAIREDPAIDVRYSTTAAGDRVVATRPAGVPEPDWG